MVKGTAKSEKEQERGELGVGVKILVEELSNHKVHNSQGASRGSLRKKERKIVKSSRLGVLCVLSCLVVFQKTDAHPPQ